MTNFTKCVSSKKEISKISFRCFSNSICSSVIVGALAIFVSKSLLDTVPPLKNAVVGKDKKNLKKS
jgi:NAD-dependent DNA ligase